MALKKSSMKYNNSETVWKKKDAHENIKPSYYLYLVVCLYIFCRMTDSPTDKSLETGKKYGE